MPNHITEIEKLVGDAERTAIRDLKRELVGDEHLRAEIIAQFNQIIKQKSEDLRQSNELACQEYSQQILVQLFGELEQIKQAILDEPNTDSF